MNLVTSRVMSLRISLFSFPISILGRRGRGSLIKIIPQTQFSYRRGLTGMAYRSSSRDLINLHIETKY